MRYIAFAIVTLFPVFIFAIYVACDYFVQKRFYKKEIESAKISADFVPVIFEAQELLLRAEIKSQKNLAWYLSQTNYVFDFGVMSIDGIELVPVYKVPKTVFDINSFKNELAATSCEARGVCLKIANTINKLFRNEHPIKYEFRWFLVRIFMHFVQILQAYKKLLEIQIREVNANHNETAKDCDITDEDVTCRVTSCLANAAA